MKLALLLAGYLRGSIQENINNIKKYIIQGHECDIYIHITHSDADSDSKYLNKNITLEFIQNELNPKVLLVSKNLTFTTDNTVNNLLNQNYIYENFTTMNAQGRMETSKLSKEFITLGISVLSNEDIGLIWSTCHSP